MSHHRLAREVAKKLAAGVGFRRAFRETMQENGISEAWDVHASKIASILARRPRGKKRLTEKVRNGIFAECLLAEMVAGAEIAASERNDHLLRDP